MAAKIPPPVPLVELPPARTVTVPGRGEFFLRDSGLLGPEHLDRPVAYLLHGWTASADINWFGQYDAVIDAGYRVLAIDHRGHGRGLRSAEPFRLSDCADDAAAVLRTMKLAPATVVGYSMGGAIAQLMTRDHPDVIGALVLSGTAQHFRDRQTRRELAGLVALRAAFAAAPRPTWNLVLSRMGLTTGNDAGWLSGELLRHSTDAIIEAGRELTRFDSRPWLRRADVPTAFVLTTRDDVVPPSFQKELIETMQAEVFEAPIRHMEIGGSARTYNPGLIAALHHVSAKAPEVQVVSQNV